MGPIFSFLYPEIHIPWIIEVIQVIYEPLNLTLQVPTPPILVVTITSPKPLPGPDIAIILLGDFHSAVSKQSYSHILRPFKIEMLYMNERILIRV